MYMQHLYNLYLDAYVVFHFVSMCMNIHNLDGAHHIKLEGRFYLWPTESNMFKVGN